MKEQFEEALKYMQERDVDGCITGSCFLGYFEDSHQDIDVFCYTEKSFTKLFYELYHNKMFTILDPMEKWKSEQFMNREQFNKHHTGITTLKFTYNTCINVNIVYKKNCSNIFSVISTFDLNIIAKGYDLKSKQYLDLTTNPGKIADYNRWNPAFNSTELWAISRILRQLERCFKYHKRGYNTDKIVIKYLELIDRLQAFENIFSSELFNEKLKITQENTLIVKKICETWLATHEITEEALLILQQKIKEI
jgi:hypothetical protein